MAPLPPATASALALRAQELLRDAADLTSGSDPNYIRDAQPDSIFEAIPLAAARQGCRRYADNPEGYSGLRQARVERACRPYLDDIGYGGEPPSIELPFRGGQCPGANYRIDWSWSAGSFSSGPQTATRVGPLSWSREGTGSLDCGPGGGTYNVYTVTDGTGDSPLSLAVGCGARIDSLTVTRLDGQPDNCGNTPPEITNPGPSPTPGTRTEPFVRPPDIDIDIDVEVNPDLTIDVDFGTGPVTIDPFGDAGGGGGGGGGGAPPGDVGDPGTPEDTGPGGEAEGEATEGTVLTGLRIDFVEPPVGGNEYAPGVYRGVCYVYMGTPEGLDHDPAGAMLRSGQFVHAEKDNFTRWSVSANMGYNLRVTPYYRAAEAED